MIKQDDILQIIRKQEADIAKLLETKRKADPVDVVAVVTECAVLQKQSFIEELRAIL